jgi:hypothetical protein
MPYSIQREDAIEDSRALRSILASLQAVGVSTSASVRLTELADSIEEQVKPAIKEPREWGSVVLAHDTGGSARMRWILTGGIWRAERHNYCTSWAGLLDVEVLRIGVGAEDPDAASFTEGFDAACNEILKDLRNLRVNAITGERQDAYDKAILAVTRQRDAK